jgi:hypothetical protein
LEDESVLVVRVKPRLAPSWDAASSGGYRDVLVNLCFKNAKSEILRQHIVEVQLHLSSFLALKHAQIGGHKTYKVARTLRVFESSRTRPCVSEVTVNQMTSVALGTVQTLDLSHLQLLPYVDVFDFFFRFFERRDFLPTISTHHDNSKSTNTGRKELFWNRHSRQPVIEAVYES